MADNDLKAFEQSLRQLEMLADTATDFEKKKPQTREIESRSKNVESLTPAFMPQPDLLTERGKNDQNDRFSKTHGGASTRKPSNNDLLKEIQDSLIGGTDNLYEKMKKNMEVAIDRQYRRKTIQHIHDRDKDAKQGIYTRKSQLIRGKSQENIADKKAKEKDKKRRQESPSPNFINMKRGSGKGSSPRFRSASKSSDDLKDFTQSGHHILGNDKKRYGTAPTADEDHILKPPTIQPSIEQIKEQHRMNSLKVVDIYRQLQNSPLLSITDLTENPTIAAEVDLNNMNNITPRSQPDESQRDILPPSASKSPQTLGKMTNAAINPTNDDIVSSTFVHVLSAFAIAEAQQDIFLRIKAYVVQNGFQLPKLNGIYSAYTFDEVREVKTSYLHSLFTQALQTAIHANWISMAHSILIHSKEMRLSVNVSKMDLSVLLHNANYEMMNLLIDYGAYFDRNERSLEAEKMSLKESIQKHQDDEEDAYSQDSRFKNMTGFRKGGSVYSSQNRGSNSSPFKAKTPSQHGGDGYQRAVSNLDQTMHSMYSNRSKVDKHETTMMQNLKRGLVAGHSQLNCSHFVRQLFDDRQSLGPKAENHLRFQKQIRALLKALSLSQGFEQVIPLLVLRGSRDLVYDMLTDKNSSKFDFELTFDIQKQLALEFFCFSISQEQLDEAINVLMKFQSHLTIKHRKRSLGEVIECMKRSAAFIELKYFLISQFYNRMTQMEAIELLDIIENRMIATYRHQSQHRVVLLQNINSLRTCLLTLFMMDKICKLIPHSDNRVQTLFDKMIEQQALILDKTSHTDFDKIILSANRRDIFSNDVLYYLANTKPGKLLNCQVIQKLIEQHWSSSYFGAQTTALLHHSSCSQIIFHSKLQKSSSARSLMLGNKDEAASSLAEAREHILTAVNFQAWKKGLNVRFSCDIFLTLIFVVFLQVFIVDYMHKDKKIDVNSPAVSFLNFFIEFNEMQQINLIDYSGFYIALTYCLVGGAFFVLAIICKAILSNLYLIHTGFKGQQNVSLGEYILFLAVASFSFFFFYTAVREPNYYPPLDNWGELIEDEFLLKFYTNLRNFDEDEDTIVSIRFWPFLVITAMWIYFFSRLQMHRTIGSYVIMLRLAAIEFGKFLVFWLVSLFTFTGITVVWFGEYHNYESIGVALKSLYLTAFGLRESPTDLESEREGGFLLLHGAFVIINLIGFLSFLTAMMTQTLVESRPKVNMLQNQYFVERLPKERYDEKSGWIACTPMLIAPLSLLFVYPFHLLVKKLSKGAKKFNYVNCAALYFPVFMIQILLFVILNLVLIPLAYFSGIYQLITQNPYQDRKIKRNKFLQVLLFILLGLPFLVLCQIPNAWYCMKSLYYPNINTDALANEKNKQSPINTRNLQRTYQVVSREILQEGQQQNPQYSFAMGKNPSDSNKAKHLLENLRNAFGVQNCVKMLFFGSIPGFSRGSSKFMGQLRRENQTITSQLECYSILKTQILAHKEKSTDELRLGLLFQYLQEIKMKMVTMKSLENYRDGKELKFIEFLSIARSKQTDETAREILQTNPNLTLQILQAEEQASQGLKDSFIVSQLQQLQTHILDQMKRQALSQQLLSGATLGQMRDNQSYMSQSEIGGGPQIAMAPLDSARTNQKKEPQVNQYQLAIAQQEAVYGLARLMQAERAPTIRDNESSFSRRSRPSIIADQRDTPNTNATPTPSETPTTEKVDDFKPSFIRKKTMTSKA